MGIISDIFEDNAEFLGQILGASDFRSRHSSDVENYVPLEKCPFCFKSFPITDLNNHYIDSHGQEHCYIRLNNSIIRDIGWAENGISAMELCLLGYKEVDLKITTNESTRSLSTNTNLDILSFMPSNFEGEIKVEVKPSQSSTKSFLIYCRSVPDFRRNDIDELIIELQRELDKPIDSLVISRWKRKIKEMPNVNALENRYFNGFYEYALGSHLEKNNKYKEAKQHFEDSFGLLAPFKTDLAQTASRILGLKMNCFAFLEGCSLNSPFAPADAFFNKSKSPEEVVYVRAEPSKTGIFIDGFSHLFLDSLVCFYNEADEQFPILLDALQRDSLSKERNNADKLYLLKARYYKHLGEKVKAVEEYSLLQYHPTFGAEAKLFIECQTKIQ